jgi:ABC-type transport system involved in multi-copper enzyme maturation permease subunit
MVSMAIGLSIGFSALIAVITGLTYDSWSDDVQAGFDPVLTTLSGWLFGIILLTVLGATAVTSEYSSKMIRTTLIINPQRHRVFAAKATVVALLGTAISAVTMVGMFLVSQPIFGFYNLETASITDSAAIRFLLVGGLVQGLIYTLIPFSIAWLLRGTASAITVSIGFFFLPWTLAPLLPMWVRENVLRYFPDSAKDSMMGMLDTDAPTYLTDGPAFFVITIWIIVAIAAAAFTLNRRDV